MAFSNSMVQCCKIIGVCGVKGRVVLDQELNHGSKTVGGGAVDWILAMFVADTNGCWWLRLKQQIDNVAIVFRDCKEDGGLGVTLVVLHQIETSFTNSAHII